MSLDVIQGPAAAVGVLTGDRDRFDAATADRLIRRLLVLLDDAAERPDAPIGDLRRLDQQFVWHPFTPMSLWHASDPLVITAADGMHLIDSDGHRYLDGVSSLWCNVHGHRQPAIDRARPGDTIMIKERWF